MKIFQYLWYIIRHKYFVSKECKRLKVPVRGFFHDLSKLRPSEFVAYLNYFYGTKQHDTEEKFNKAWLLHLKRNPHHYQYWILNMDDGSTKCLPMPEQYIREMIADWIGAGIAITGKREVEEWFDKNYSKIKPRMHPASFNRVLEILNWHDYTQKKSSSEGVSV